MQSETPKLEILSSLVGYNLRRASLAFNVDFAAAMEGTGMRQVLFGIMSVVATNPGINQGAVGRLLSVKRANMVALITELTDRGLLERILAPGDRRAFALTITPAGREMLEECLRRIEGHEARLLSGFTNEERKTLIHLLGRIEAPQG
jgi:DNA-binding MarR family transcriptional regulator